MKFVITATSPGGEVEQMAMKASPQDGALDVVDVVQATEALYQILKLNPKGFHFPEGTSFKVEPYVEIQQ